MTSGAVEVARGLASSTYLFVPGDRPERFAKADGAGADVVILDLEDAVAPANKDGAREHVAGWAGTHACAVRINAVGRRPARRWCRPPRSAPPRPGGRGDGRQARTGPRPPGPGGGLKTSPRQLFTHQQPTISKESPA
ncbi:hypothetical protein GCM10023147_27660 [Tsukamurella soli]|uniref:HpcH/HpaI aldolase/citrate lyase domain-containing protein n=1 Tax=Tsukamurella soli TaxID=644556 RepID=A0ABP8JRQ3_9ACTN